MQRWPNDQVKLETHAFIICMGVHLKYITSWVLCMQWFSELCLDANANRKWGKSPVLRTVLLKTPKRDCALRVYEDKEFYQLGF